MRGLILTQSHYIEKVFKRSNQFDCKPVTTPFDTSMKLYPNTGKVVDQLEFARVIGCLMYAMTCTKPDIAYVVGKISRYTSNPSHIHWIVVQRILKYLKKTINYGILYSRYPTVLEGYTNANWITDNDDHKSTNGWIFTFGGGALS
jgi:hypothetical protein